MRMRPIVGPVVVGACVLLALAIWRLTVFSQVATAQDDRMTASFIPNPSNETSLSVRGWRRSELNQILTDFLRLYGLSDQSEYKLEAKSDDTFVITFPGDIQPTLCLFLVNYVRYPQNFDLSHRSIGVLGHVVLSAAFGAPDTLVGKRAAIYVPSNDIEFDLVYAKVESQSTYRISFTNLIWEAARDARVPKAISGL
jgi:hypothetical protein